MLQTKCSSGVCKPFWQLSLGNLPKPTVHSGWSGVFELFPQTRCFSILHTTTSICCTECKCLGGEMKCVCYVHQYNSCFSFSLNVVVQDRCLTQLPALFEAHRNFQLRSYLCSDLLSCTVLTILSRPSDWLTQGQQCWDFKKNSSLDTPATKHSRGCRVMAYHLVEVFFLYCNTGFTKLLYLSSLLI